MIAAVFLVLSLQGEAPAPVAWTFEAVADPMTDAQRGIAQVQGDGRSGLVVKCDSGGRGMYVHLLSDEFLGGDGARSDVRNLTYRIDQRPPVTRRWTHKDAWAAALGRDAAPVIADLMSGESILIRASRYDYRTVDMRFSLAGARDAIARAYEACGAGSPPV